MQSEKSCGGCPGRDGIGLVLGCAGAESLWWVGRFGLVGEVGGRVEQEGAGAQQKLDFFKNTKRSMRFGNSGNMPDHGFVY